MNPPIDEPHESGNGFLSWINIIVSISAAAAAMASAYFALIAANTAKEGNAIATQAIQLAKDGQHQSDLRQEESNRLAREALEHAKLVYDNERMSKRPFLRVLSTQYESPTRVALVIQNEGERDAIIDHFDLRVVREVLTDHVERMQTIRPIPPEYLLQDIFYDLSKSGLDTHRYVKVRESVVPGHGNIRLIIDLPAGLSSGYVDLGYNDRRHLELLNFGMQYGLSKPIIP